jgi:hypothetical protein
MTPRVLLADTTRWPNSARLAIGLSKAGCDVFAICPSHHPFMKTSVVRNTLSYSGLSPLTSLLEAIDVTNPDIIIPCDDRAVWHLHELYKSEMNNGSSKNKIAELIIRSIGDPESYPIVSSRYNFLGIASREGIRVPDTRILNTLDDLKILEAREPFPWVIKADGTSGGRGVKIANTFKEAKAGFWELRRQFTSKRVLKRLIVNRDAFWIRPWWMRFHPAVSVQSYIHGHPSNCAVLSWQGEMLAGISVEVVSVQAATGPACVVRIIDNPEMLFAAERIAKRLGMSGFFGLDFIIEKHSGLAYLIEINPRLTPPGHLQFGKGRDLIEALVAQLSHRPYHDLPPVSLNDLVAYFPQAWDCQSEFISSSYHDLPHDEPELVEELLRPWPDRTFLFRMCNYIFK